MNEPLALVQHRWVIERARAGWAEIGEMHEYEVCIVDLADALAAKRAECEALRAALRDCLEAMQAWGTEEDGIPDWSPPAPANPWGAWQRARAALGEEEHDDGA